MTDNSKTFNMCENDPHLNFDWGGIASGLITSGGNAFTASQTTKAAQTAANASAAASAAAIEVERLRTEQARILAGQSASGKGMSTGAIVGISLGGVAVLGTIIFLAVRKK